LIASARTAIGRVLWCALAVMAFGAAAAFAKIAPALIAALAVTTAVLTWMSLRTSARERLLFAVCAWPFTTAVFAIGAFRANSTLLETLGRAGVASDAIVDVITTPRAANPLCYSAIAVALTGERYRAILAQVATVPWLLGANHCAPDRSESTAAISPIQIPAERAVAWHGSFEGELAELTALAKRCDVAAALRFLRVPHWQRTPDGTLILGDLRYDRSRQLEFAELEFPSLPVCPPNVPPWLPPRRELFTHAVDAAGAGTGR
jgi:inner membrane protein